MNFFVVREENNNRLSTIGWTILFIIELTILIYWNFISSKPFNIYTAWINIFGFFGGITLGWTIKETFSRRGGS